MKLLEKSEGLSYEEMRLFYEGYEEREQKNIVVIQRLLLRVKELEQKVQQQGSIRTYHP